MVMIRATLLGENIPNGFKACRLLSLSHVCFAKTDLTSNDMGNPGTVLEKPYIGKIHNMDIISVPNFPSAKQ